MPDDGRNVRTYYVYILASLSRTLYVGMTSDLTRRMSQHTSGAVPGFTRDYNVSRLVYIETVDSARSATERERQIKRWRREKKIALIEAANPGWADLAETWTALTPRR